MHVYGGEGWHMIHFFLSEKEQAEGVTKWKEKHGWTSEATAKKE